MSIPRPEHPKPQFMRQTWQNLNGLWQFEIDNGRSGFARGLSEADACLSGQILVPFCPESKLSGIGYTDYMDAVWYHRVITVSAEEMSGRVLIHFGAVDYRCKVFINGIYVGGHEGGYCSFSIDITDAVKLGDNEITVYVGGARRDRHHDESVAGRCHARTSGTGGVFQPGRVGQH